MIPSKQRVAEILAGKSSDSRAGDLRDLGAYIAHLEAQRGGAVVVAELTKKEALQILNIHRENWSEAVNKWFRENSRAVDAYQVLHPGMVQVDRAGCQGENCGTLDGKHSPECIVAAAESQGWAHDPLVAAARKFLELRKAGA